MPVSPLDINLDLSNIGNHHIGYSGKETQAIVQSAVQAVASVVASGRVREVEQHYLAQQRQREQEEQEQRRRNNRLWITGTIAVAGLTLLAFLYYQNQS